VTRFALYARSVQDGEETGIGARHLRLDARARELTTESFQRQPSPFATCPVDAVSCELEAGVYTNATAPPPRIAKRTPKRTHFPLISHDARIRVEIAPPTATVALPQAPKVGARATSGRRDMTSECTQCEPVRPAASAAVVDQPRTAGDGRSSDEAPTHRLTPPLLGRYLPRDRNLTKLTASVRSTDRVETERSGMAR
jgi:hypothetical protein